MNMCYEGALVMPSSYAVMNEEEMTYVEGGLGYSWVMRTKVGCKGLGKNMHANGYNKISATDIAAEIYTHAFIHYNMSGFLVVAAAAGVSKAGKILASVENGIDIENGLDKRKVAGVYYYQLYRAIYNFGPVVF